MEGVRWGICPLMDVECCIERESISKYLNRMAGMIYQKTRNFFKPENICCHLPDACADFYCQKRQTLIMVFQYYDKTFKTFRIRIILWNKIMFKKFYLVQVSSVCALPNSKKIDNILTYKCDQIAL